MKKPALKKWLGAVFTVLLLLGCSKDDPSPMSPDPGNNDGNMNNENPGNSENPVIVPPVGFTPCESGYAGIYACKDYDFLGRLSLQDLNARSANDIWGWTDPITGKEYALVGLDNGTAFVDITDTENLRFVAKLPTATSTSAWRDIKVYQDMVQ